MGAKTIETKDLIIRETVFRDLEYFDGWERMPEVTEFFSIPAGQSKEDLCHKYFLDKDDPAAAQFTILLKRESGAMPCDAAPGSTIPGSTAPGHGGNSRPGAESAPEDEAGSPIGRIVLADIIPGWKAELWRIYIADPALRGRSYGKQALTGMVRYCFQEYDLQRLYLDFYSGNPAEHLYKKVGFIEEGVLRGNCRKDGVLHDVHLMSMMRDEYERLL